MDNSFFTYLQQLELLAFFSGYPLLYAVIFFIAGKDRPGISFKGKIISLLPFSYALVGTLFLGFQLKKLYPDYSFHHMVQSLQSPFLIVWGILSILFWIPTVSKKPVISLLHSLIFFFFIARDLFLHLFQSHTDKNIVRNDMKIYSGSLLLNLGIFFVIVIFYFLFSQVKKRLRQRPYE